MSETQLHFLLTPPARKLVPCTDEPLELEDKSDDKENDNTNKEFIERKQDETPLSLPLSIYARRSSQYNLRPPKPKHAATLCKQIIPTNYTIDTSKDLLFILDMINKLNIICYNQNMMNDDNHLPVIDAHPTKLLST